MAVDMGLSVAVPTVCLFQSGHGLFSDRRTKLFTSISPRFSSCQSSYLTDTIPLSRRTAENKPRQVLFKMPKSTGSSSSNDTQEDSEAPPNQTKAPFGYTRKDVLLIGLGVTVTGISLKSGLEFVGVDSLQAGNAVQLVMVLGLTIGWITTYIFRVSNKDMTYAQQLRDYENKVMQKRLEGLTEAELEALLEQVEEDKRRLASGEQVK